MKKAMIYGAGVSGRSVEALLQRMGYETIMVDDRNGISSTDATSYLDGVELFIKSPGIPYNDLVREVQDRNIEIFDEIEIAYRYMKDTSKTKVIAITGTNGKTTTTSKLAELLNRAGYKSVAAGNIGVPFSSVVMEDQKYDYIVLELSSYQLENLKEFKANIAMIINLAPDHLDRYEGAKEYYDTKFNIGINQGRDDKFLVNIDDEEILKRMDKINGEKIKISLNKIADFYVEGKKLMDRDGIIGDIEKFSLKGKHNLQNILFIVGVAKLLGISNGVITEFLENTENLEHRMEEFYVYMDKNKKIEFINDSKGTNLESTLKAVGAFKNPILICGGKDKNLDLKPLIEEIVENVEEVYLIGEIGDNFEKQLIENNYPKEKIHNLNTLERVVQELRKSIEDKTSNLTVLFSPATSSFDQFKNFEERGRIFKELVREKF